MRRFGATIPATTGHRAKLSQAAEDPVVPYHYFLHCEYLQ
jgi:hypothetical protein